MNHHKAFLGMLALSLSLVTGLQNSFAGPTQVKECLAAALARENPIFQVNDAASSTDKFNRYLVTICNNKPAQELFDSLEGDGTPGEWAGKTRGEIKFLGEENGASMCYHIHTNSEGTLVNEYACSIRLNISGRTLGKTKDIEMKPFSLK